MQTLHGLSSMRMGFASHRRRERLTLNSYARAQPRTERLRMGNRISINLPT